MGEKFFLAPTVRLIFSEAAFNAARLAHAFFFYEKRL
ncbi:MAG: hypothetical protein S4CHLAM102_10770 [Chlamydiia bacterium]|nr:hypothetical protein [Chlamydiia bacterium]